MTLEIHPEHVIVFSVVYHPFRNNSSSFIRSFGALEVKLQSGTDVSFARHHHVYPEKGHLEPFRDMRNLVDSQTDCVCVLARRGLTHYPDQLEILGEEVRQAVPIADLGLYANTFVLQIGEETIRAYADQYKIPLAKPTAGPSEQARRAADRAQVNYITWLHKCLLEDPDQQSLLAAFQAWRMVDDLRPVTF